ncbi:MAG: hypothetical protein ACRDLQ_06240, partial [Solirubrobacterales bacterium]
MAPFSLIALIVLAVFTASAAAAPPWSPPESVSSPSLFVSQPQVVFDAQGRGLAIWGWSGPRADRNVPPPGGLRLAVREPGATEFGPERTAPNFVTSPVAYGLSRVLALDSRQRGSDESRISLRARFGRSGGKFGSPRTISTFTQPAGPPSLAAPNGAVAAWIANASRGRRVVRVALRRSGRGFGRPVTLRGRGRANDVVAGAALGVVFVAWERAGVVEARVKLSSRRSWGPVRRLGDAQPFATTFRVVGAGRRAYLAWLAEKAESAVVRDAVLPAAGARNR